MKIKSLILVLLLLIPSSFVFAEDEKIPEITKISYDGNLSSDSEIIITGKYLDNCSNLLIGKTEANILTQTESKITYNFSDKLDYYSVVYLTCGEYKINYTYDFPHIISGNIDNIDKIDGKLAISGEYFGDAPTVSFLDGKNLVIDSKSSNTIIGTMNTSLTSSGFYIVNGGLKSNIYSINGLNFPHIDYVTSDTGFYNQSTIVIHGTHLNDYNRVSVDFDGDAYEQGKLKYDEDKGTVSFIVNKSIPGTYTLSLTSNYFKSNEINIEIIGNDTRINSINDIEIDGVYYVQIKGENLGISTTTKLYINGVQKNIYKYSSESTLLVEKSMFTIGDNIVELRVNGISSNSVNYEYKSGNLPFLTSYEIGSIDGNYRNIVLYGQNYDPLTDKIYFNSSLVSDIKSYSNKISCTIPSTLLSGYFYIERNGYKMKLSRKLDLESSVTPFITKAVFYGAPEAGTKFDIEGGNFNNSTVYASNLFQKNTDNTIKYSLSDTKISGILGAEYYIGNTSNISINSYGKTVNFSFLGKDYEGQESFKIYGAPIINNFISIDGNDIYKPGDKVGLDGVNIEEGNTINIGSSTTSVIVDTEISTYPYFIVPDGLDGSLSLTVENSEGLRSQTKTIFLLGSDQYEGLILSNDKLTNSGYTINSNEGFTSKPVYVLKLTDKINDGIIEKLEFNIDSEIDYSDIGSFYLQYNSGSNKKYAVLNNKNTLSFSDLEFSRSSSDLTFYLYKSSDFLDTGKISISIGDNYKIKNLSGNYFSNIKNNTTTSTITISEGKYEYCYDSKSSKANCDIYNGINNTENITSDESVEEKVEEETTNKDTTIENIETEELATEEIVIENNYFEININKLDFKSSSLAKLNLQFMAFGNKLEKISKYKDKSSEIQDTINDLLETLYKYENVGNNKTMKKLLIMKIKLKVNTFKSLLK